MQATFSRLKSGNWGVRVVCSDPFDELPKAGAEIEVTKKDESVDLVKVTRQVWSGERDGQQVGLYALD